MSERICHYCGKPGCGKNDEMRPYGPGGTWIGYDCMTATPEREQAARRVFGGLLDAAIVIGGGTASIGTEDGVQPGLGALADEEPPR